MDRAMRRPVSPLKEGDAESDERVACVGSDELGSDERESEHESSE
jgi:hypothetical protein